MKLKNKLIPLAVSLTTVGVITPLTLVSCGDAIKLYDITDGSFIPDFDAKEPETIPDQVSITKEYSDWVKANPSKFGQDLAYGTYLNWIQSLPKKESGRAYYAELNDLTVGATTPTFGSTTVSYPSEPSVRYPTVSTKIKLHAEFTLHFYNKQDNPDYPANSGYDISYVLDTTSKLSNMLFFVQTHGMNEMLAKEALTNNANTHNIWNVTMFNRGDAYAYNYRDDIWSMDISSTCKRKMVIKENGLDVKVDERTNSFSADINNVMLFTYVQEMLGQGNKIFEQLMALRDEGFESYEIMHNLVDKLTGIKSSSADKQLDLLIYSASAGTIDFASYYLSKYKADFSFNTNNTLTSVPDGVLPSQEQEKYSMNEFKFFADPTNLDSSSWYLSRGSVDALANEEKIKDIAEIKLTEAALKSIAACEERYPASSDKKLYLTLKGAIGTGATIYSAGTSQELYQPLKFMGVIKEKDAAGDLKDHYLTYDECDYYVNQMGRPVTFTIPVKELPVEITYKDGSKNADSKIIIESRTIEIQLDGSGKKR